jgi:hypothetical protein
MTIASAMVMVSPELKAKMNVYIRSFRVNAERSTSVSYIYLQSYKKIDWTTVRWYRPKKEIMEHQRKL